MRILHFTGKGYGFMEGVTEYVVLIEDDEDVDEQACPGFKLESNTLVKSVITEMPTGLPMGSSLVPRD